MQSWCYLLLFNTLHLFMWMDSFAFCSKMSTLSCVFTPYWRPPKHTKSGKYSTGYRSETTFLISTVSFYHLDAGWNWLPVSENIKKRCRLWILRNFQAIRLQICHFCLCGQPRKTYHKAAISCPFLHFKEQYHPESVRREEQKSVATNTNEAPQWDAETKYINL